MPASTAADRREIAALGAHVRWATETDRQAATAAAREGLRARFEAEIPPEVTDPVQRASMIDHAIAARLIAARRRKRAAAKAAAELAVAGALLAEVPDETG